MVKKKRENKFNISNRLAYTLMIILSIALLGIGVYANTAGVKPNPGHFLSELSPDKVCSTGQAAIWNGTHFACATIVDSRFTVAPDGLLCFDAPAHCSLEIKHCSAKTGSFDVDVKPSVCSDWDEEYLKDFCRSRCADIYGSIACNGHISLCGSGSGGTAVAWSLDGTTAFCKHPSSVRCNCGSNELYSQEVYHSAGQRCI